VAELYGDDEPPTDDMSPADRLWFTAQEAADEIERLRAIVTDLAAISSAHDATLARLITRARQATEETP
jgi:hypothetical protein